MTRLAIDRHLPSDYLAESLREDVLRGLTASPKSLSPKWFYDARGSELFEQITRLPEYYPTRAEREILTDHAAEIVAATGADTLVELGSGSSEKTRLLLSAMRRAPGRYRYVPVDVSETALLGAAEALLADYPDLSVHAVLGDFTAHLDLLPAGGRRLTAFLGGTIGNLDPSARGTFLAAVRGDLRDGDAFLLGTDLVKDPAVLVAAYDDAAGVTGEFNRNLLRVLNRELGADFDVEGFSHVARWNADEDWIEMRLRSARDQTVKLGELGLAVDFAAGEEMRTEISAKFRREAVEAELAAAGFELRHWWTDRQTRFALSLSVPA